MKKVCKIVINEMSETGVLIEKRLEQEFELTQETLEQNLEQVYKKVIMKNLYPNRDFVLDRNIKYVLEIEDLIITGVMYFSFSSYFQNIDILKNGHTYCFGYSKDNALFKPQDPMKKRHLDCLISFANENGLL